MSEFDREEFKKCYPVAFLMRNYRADWWFRIHSLPESKRYPGSATDWEILLSRHRSLSDAVLIPGTECRVIYAQFAGFPFPDTDLPRLRWQPFRNINAKDEDSLDSWIATDSWDFDTFEPWIRARSSDELAFIGFHSLTTDSLYMPYDGGADIFSLRPGFLRHIREQFEPWKSPLESGL
jgi:hypothetical protein